MTKQIRLLVHRYHGEYRRFSTRITNASQFFLQRYWVCCGAIREINGSLGGEPCRGTMDTGRAEGRSCMCGRAVIASMFLIGACVAMTAHASEVTTYGAGLKSCAAYLDARERQNTDEVAFVEWFSGYASGVNSTSNHTNNILGDPNLKEAVYRLGNYCRAHPVTPVAVALDVLVIGARSRSRQTAEVTAISQQRSTGLTTTAARIHVRVSPRR